MTARDQVEDVAKLLRYAVAEVRDTVETSLSVGERKHVSAAIEHLTHAGIAMGMADESMLHDDLRAAISNAASARHRLELVAKMLDRAR